MSASTRTRTPVPWKPVVLLALVMAYADGFWLTSLQEAVGAIERAQQPFLSWVVESTLAVPVFVLAVLGAIAVARNWFGPTLRTPRRVLAAAVLIVAAGTVVGIAEVAASSAYDYHLQSGQVMMAASMRTEPAGTMSDLDGMSDMKGMAGMSAGPADPADSGGAGRCLGRCEAMRMTRAVHVRAVSYSAGVILLTNLVLVGWVVAMRGGRLEVAPRSGRAVRRLAEQSA